jgi:hypothetical protein
VSPGLSRRRWWAEPSQWLGLSARPPPTKHQKAEFVDEANATTCADVGDSSPSILFANGNANNSNSDVSGTVTNNGTRDVLNVTVLNPAIQVNAVVVKGGDGYNLYHRNFPDMITPNTTGGVQPLVRLLRPGPSASASPWW